MIDLQKLEQKIDQAVSQLTTASVEAWYREAVVTYYGSQGNIDDDEFGIDLKKERRNDI